MSWAISTICSITLKRQSNPYVDIQKLLNELNSSGVESFEGYGLKISFKKQYTLPNHVVGIHPEKDSIKEEKAPDIEPDAGFDQVLHWSSGADDFPLPLTGEGHV